MFTPLSSPRIVSRLWLLLIAVLLSSATALHAKPRKKSSANHQIVVTDYITLDGKTDVADRLQELINSNPNRTIHFPDGIYPLSHPISTPADPRKSVHLVLDNYACLKAIGPWSEGGAVVRLGAIEPVNDIFTPGSNYGLTGGIIDCSNVADGISVDGGRETRVTDLSIKNARIGVHVKWGANSGSADADFQNINITGNHTPQSVGILVEGFDNTFRNFRIAGVHTGVHLKSGGNSLRDIHPLFIFNEKQTYPTSCGFIVETSDNWLDYCYSDQMATGFRLAPGVRATLTSCYCYWYTGQVPSQTAVEAANTLQSNITGLRAVFSSDCPSTTLLKSSPGGTGRLYHPILNDNYRLSSAEKSYIAQ